MAAMSEDERIAYKAKRNTMLQQRRDEHAAKRERLEKVLSRTRAAPLVAAAAMCKTPAVVNASQGTLHGSEDDGQLIPYRSMWHLSATFFFFFFFANQDDARAHGQQNIVCYP